MNSEYVLIMYALNLLLYNMSSIKMRALEFGLSMPIKFILIHVVQMDSTPKFL